MKYISQPRQHQSHHFQNWLSLFAFRQFRANIGFISHQRTIRKHTNFKAPLMKIEKVVLRNEWRGIRSVSFRLFISTFTPRPLWLTWATMCTYRVQTFNSFKTGTISIILSAFENWKFKQSLTKMIERWMTWQDFPLKRKRYYLLFWLYFARE